MLETSEERVKLLKAGISARRIEQLYIINNNFKIVNIPGHLEAFEIILENQSKELFCDLRAECVNA